VTLGLKLAAGRKTRRGSSAKGSRGAVKSFLKDAQDGRSGQLSSCSGRLASEAIIHHASMLDLVLALPQVSPDAADQFNYTKGGAQRGR
jgi:hypothetical protein